MRLSLTSNVRALSSIVRMFGFVLAPEAASTIEALLRPRVLKVPPDRSLPGASDNTVTYTFIKLEEPNPARVVTQRSPRTPPDEAGHLRVASLAVCLI